MFFIGGPTQKSEDAASASKSSHRNNFEHCESRKAILKNTLAEIEKEVGML